MNSQRLLNLCVSIVLLVAIAQPAFARGFGGGGGFRGGGGFGGGGFHGGGGFGGGGFGGGGGDRFGGGGFDRSAGGFGGGGFDRSAGSFGGGGFDRSADGFGGGGFDRSAGNFGGGFRGGGFGGAGGLGRDGAAGGFDRGNFGAAPSRQSLNGFLGLPSDDGFHGLGGSSPFTVNHASVEGPRGGVAAGATVEGPRGNEAGRGVAVGPDGGVAAARGVKGAGGGKAAQGIAVGPGGRVAGGSAVRGPQGYGGGRGFVAGPNGYAAGFSRVTPNARYVTGAAVRTNFNHYGIYGHGWYTNHPGAWYAAGWAAGSAWTATSWASLGSWFDYGDTAPVDYNYGSNVTYNDNTVYVNNQPAGTADQWYQQAANLATTGAKAQPSTDADWMPLGVFALSQKGYDNSNVAIQLAVDKQGIIRGNYTDTFADQPQTIQGSVDKKTQKVAFTVGTNQTTVFETGLYNLTENEAPVLIHFGSDRTQQWLLVRLKQPADSAAAQSTGTNP